MTTLQTSKLATLSSSAPPATAATPSLSTTPAMAQKSPWRSPVPYLFGGLAAMLGLIAFALLLLACSYWRLSRNSNGEENGQRDLERGLDGKSEDSAAVKVMPIFEEKIVVIMAGDVKPTFLATPVSSRAAAFGEGVKRNENFGKGMEEIAEKPKLELAEENHEDDRTSRSQEAARESPEEQN